MEPLEGKGPLMTTQVRRLALGAAAVLAITFAGPPATAAPTVPIGAVSAIEELPRDFWIPGTATAKRFTYTTSGPGYRDALSTGTVFIPKGAPPLGGWPVLSWAHGTVGLADQCAPSRTGPSERDTRYLATWLEQGYAIVATDYAGLGTEGGMPYLDGEVEAHNVVDIVKAGQNLGLNLSKTWVTIGQSQGAGAAITTARHATDYGPDLDYRGAVGTGVPAYIENIVATAGPNMPPIALPKGMTAYGLMILAGLNVSHPELDLPSFLNDRGRDLLDKANTLCLGPFEEYAAGTVLGDIFTRPASDIPNFHALLTDYMGMPESGFDKPFFIGQGLGAEQMYALRTLLDTALSAAERGRGPNH